MAIDPRDARRARDHAHSQLPSFLPTGFIEILRACEVDGKVVTPRFAADPRGGGQITGTARTTVD